MSGRTKSHHYVPEWYQRRFLGSHTLFPLSLNCILVITNLGYVRNPKVSGTKPRENPRYYERGMLDLRKIRLGVS